MVHRASEQLNMSIQLFATVGRGLSNFAEKEITEKIPSVCNIHSLGEGKLAFTINLTPASLSKHAAHPSPPQICCCSTHKIPSRTRHEGGKDITQKTTNSFNSCRKNEHENDIVHAVSQVYKLKLIERIFILLHSQQTNEECIGQARLEKEMLADLTAEHYKEKLRTVVEEVQWEQVVVRVQQLREGYEKQREARVLCLDPAQCLGCLHRRRDKQRCQAKRKAASNSLHFTEQKKYKTAAIERTSLQGAYFAANPRNAGHVGEQCITDESRRCVNSSDSVMDDELQQITVPKTNAEHDDQNSAVDYKTINATKLTAASSQEVNEHSNSAGTEAYRSHNEVKLNIELGVQTTSFRVSCRISGKHKKQMTVQWLTHMFTQQLTETMPFWHTDWRQPLMDLYLNMTDSHLILGAALADKPLSLRSYIPHVTLRSTACYLMALLAQIPPSGTILDPMCGGGTILLEAAINFDVGHVIGSDMEADQLEVAKCNLQRVKGATTLLQADAAKLPLPSSSVNAVLCDFPFGQKHKLTREPSKLLRNILRETQRVLMSGGKAVFLISSHQHQSLLQLVTHSHPPAETPDITLALENCHSVSLGETSACVAVLHKEVK